ncbi:MAG: acetate--CoA ligase family protein, partial [Alphaproteobacteria bacterium]|nr:acetate--CoA ligase family protein [Alphaproteobacteria bacterium]
LPRVLAVCLEAPEVDAVALAGHFGGYHRIGGAALETREVAAAAEVAELAKATARPLVVHSIYAGERLAALETLRGAGIPVLRAPEAAAALLAGLHRAGAAVPAPVSRQGVSEPCRKAARAVLAEAPSAGALLEPASRRLVAAYGIAVPDFDLVDTAEACAWAAADGRPKALKLIAPGIVHRSEVGGVLLGVSGEAAARQGFETLIGRLPADSRAGTRVLVTAMVEAGVEVVCGAVRDPQFGPVVMFGLGGVAVEALADVTFRLAPLAPEEALAMLDEVRGRALLAAHRGRPAVDRQAVAEILVRLGELMADLAEVTEVDLNPVFLRADGATLADARVVLGAGVASPPFAEATVDVEE